MSRFLRRLGIVLLLAAGPLLAPLTGERAMAAGTWSAWLYQQETGRLARIYTDGLPGASLTLPLPPGVVEYPYEPAVSPDGEVLAACVTSPAEVTTIYVYDFAAAAFRASYTVPGGRVEACHVGRQSFSPDGTQLAFGLLYHYPDPADSRPDWEVIVMDTASGAIRGRLASTSPAVTALGRDYAGSRPTITAFRARMVAFAPVRWGTEGMAEYDSLIWQMGTGAVSLAGPYGKISLESLGEEMIWIEVRDDFPKGSLGELPVIPFNVVMFAGSGGAAWQPIFHQSGAVIERALYIEGGRRIAVRTFTAPGLYRWWALDRSGGSVALGLPADADDVWGTPEGYVYLDPDGGPAGGPLLVEQRTAGAPEAVPRWTADPGSFWQIVWVTPLDADLTLPPFPAAAAPLSPGLMVTPVLGGLAPTPTPIALAIGMEVMVHTTEGDRLRVRSGPGTDFPVLFDLPNGALATLMSGPAAGSGYTWWYLRAWDGRTGWAVEGVPEAGGWLQTLVPTG